MNGKRTYSPNATQAEIGTSKFFAGQRVLLIVLSLIVFGQMTRASGESWAWCGTSETAPTGQRVTIYYSDPFEERDDASYHDYIVAFADYVRSHYDAPTAVGQCFIGLATRSDAAAARDDGAARVKARGDDVVFTSWTY